MMSAKPMPLVLPLFPVLVSRLSAVQTFTR